MKSAAHKAVSSDEDRRARLAQLKQLDWLRVNRPRSYDRLMIALAEIVAVAKGDERSKPTKTRRRS